MARTYPTVDAALKAFLAKHGYPVQAPLTGEGQAVAAKDGSDAVRIMYGSTEVGAFPSEWAFRQRLVEANQPTYRGAGWDGLQVYNSRGQRLGTVSGLGWS